MSKPSLEAKKAHFAKIRQSNYTASLRLEGFKVSRSDVDGKSLSRDSSGAIRSRNA